jgi:outer membrane lipoprotein-sorting protein
MNVVRNWAVRVGVLVLCSTLWGADDLAAVYARMDQAAPKFKGMRAEMKRISHTALINIDETETGSILVKVPKPHDYHMLIDFQQPDQKTAVVSGTMAEIYLPKANEIQEYNFGKGHKSEIEQFLKLGFGSTSAELRGSYTVTYGGPETVAGQKATRIVLIPKSKDLAATFPKFELWISDEAGSSGISIQQKMYEASGNYTIATYSKVRLDPNIPDSALKLNAPKGAARRRV